MFWRCVGHWNFVLFFQDIEDFYNIHQCPNNGDLESLISDLYAERPTTVHWTFVKQNLMNRPQPTGRWLVQQLTYSSCATTDDNLSAENKSAGLQATGR